MHFSRTNIDMFQKEIITMANKLRTNFNDQTKAIITTYVHLFLKSFKKGSVPINSDIGHKKTLTILAWAHPLGSYLQCFQE